MERGRDARSGRRAGRPRSKAGWPPAGRRATPKHQRSSDPRDQEGESMAQPTMLRPTVAAGLLALAAATLSDTAAQPPRRQPTPNDTLVSPEVQPDHKVTFRLYAPKASEVTLRGDWMESGPVKLEKDDKGVWSA